MCRRWEDLHGTSGCVFEVQSSWHTLICFISLQGAYFVIHHHLVFGHPSLSLAPSYILSRKRVVASILDLRYAIRLYLQMPNMYTNLDIIRIISLKLDVPFVIGFIVNNLNMK